MVEVPRCLCKGQNVPGSEIRGHTETIPGGGDFQLLKIERSEEKDRKLRWSDPQPTFGPAHVQIGEGENEDRRNVRSTVNEKQTCKCHPLASAKNHPSCLLKSDRQG